MRVVIQRVTEASIHIGTSLEASIDGGLVILAAFARGDDEDILRWMADKIISLRIFEDESGKMNLSQGESGGAIMVVSQFTLYGNCRKGRRPSFEKSAGPDKAEALYNRFLEILREHRGLIIESGVFGRHMHVSLVNDGPVTLIIDKD